MSDASRPKLVFVHGLWMTGAEAFSLRRRLEREHGFDTELFAYRTTRDPLEAVAERLQQRVSALARQGAKGVHLVAHSLGGLVVLACLEQFDALMPPGRIVLLGAPVRGSAAARVAGAIGVGQWLIGPSAAEALVSHRRRVAPVSREVGTIAGTRPMGLGRWFARFDEPNDGTVAVSETQLEGARDRLVLPVSHLGMLMSPRVAEACGHFLREGRFSLQA
jgi:pimeloyl-ACP methyl ester carboxylesterase